MSCVQRLLNKNYRMYLSLCRAAVGGRDAEDLLHDLCEMVLGNDKYVDLCHRDELDRYIKGSIRICGHSSTTRYHYKYRKHERDAKEFKDYMATSSTTADQYSEPDRTEELELLYDALANMRWYHAEMLTTYYLEQHTAKSLSDVTGISKSSVAGAVRKAKEEARKEVAVQRARRHSREGDTGDGHRQGSQEGSGRGLRVQQAQGMAEPEIPIQQREAADE